MKRTTALVLALLLAAGGAQAARVEGLRMWTGPEGTRLVFDTDGPVEHRVFVLKSPHRVVVDLKHSRLAARLPQPGNDPLLRRLRWAPREGGDLRVVLDLKQPVRPKSFLLKPNAKYGYRLVLDLAPRTARPQPRRLPPPRGPRDLIIAVDAGHGGEDPGALGRRGTREKDVVLAIARRLARAIDAEPGMRAVLIRRGDYYVGLRERMRLARRHRADLFVSIHADSFRDRRARGASVYVLSQKGASSVDAQFLADSENRADLIGGVSLDDKDELLASVLLDLSQNATLAASTEVARAVLGRLRRLGPVHRRQVERAGFVVLKSPDVPSILVETGFISNPREERKLRDPAHQRRLAQAVLAGIKDYFRNNPPAGTRYAMAPRRHVIRRGETLSGIAARYQVSTERLRAANRLRGDLLRVGQVLAIPLPSGS